METLTFFVYVDGSNLEEIESELVKNFSGFVSEWGIDTAQIVNTGPQLSEDLRESDLPEWNLGLNFTIDCLPREKIQDLVRFLSNLARETNRVFVIGCRGEDWFYINAEPQGNLVELLAEQIAC